MRDEEEAALAAAGEPMRNYLVNNIFPTLTTALLEVAKLRPKDPIDFLVSSLYVASNMVLLFLWFYFMIFFYYSLKGRILVQVESKWENVRARI